MLLFASARSDAGAGAGPLRPKMARSMLSEKEHQRSAMQRAMSLAEFCERYGIGRTKAYEELNSGRLRGRKSGRRTIITEDDAEDWLRRLPTMRGAVEAPR
jgi:excisionase family DNA binding protein